MTESDNTDNYRQLINNQQTESGQLKINVIDARPGWQMSIKIDLSTKFGFPAAHYTRKNLDWLLLVAANSLAIIAEHLNRNLIL